MKGSTSPPVTPLAIVKLNSRRFEATVLSAKDAEISIGRTPSAKQAANSTSALFDLVIWSSVLNDLKLASLNPTPLSVTCEPQ